MNQKIKYNFFCFWKQIMMIVPSWSSKRWETTENSHKAFSTFFTPLRFLWLATIFHDNQLSLSRGFLFFGRETGWFNKRQILFKYLSLSKIQTISKYLKHEKCYPFYITPSWWNMGRGTKNNFPLKGFLALFKSIS